MADTFKDPTYKSDRYAMFRPKYPDEIFTTIFKHVFPEENDEKNKVEKGGGIGVGNINPSNTLAVDVGCGPGVCSLQLASKFTKVIAIDPSDRQLAVAPPKENIKYIQGGAEDLHKYVSGNSADLIFVAQTLHWLSIDDFVMKSKNFLKQNDSSALAVVWYHLMYIADGTSYSKPVEIPHNYSSKMTAGDKDTDSANNNYNSNKTNDDNTIKVFVANSLDIPEEVYAEFPVHQEATKIYFEQMNKLPWDERRKILNENYASITFPYKTIVNKCFVKLSKIRFDALLEYVRTWSALQHLNEEQKQVFFDELQSGIMQAMHLKDLSDELTVCTRFCLKMCSDPENR